MEDAITSENWLVVPIDTKEIWFVHTLAVNFSLRLTVTLTEEGHKATTVLDAVEVVFQQNQLSTNYRWSFSTKYADFEAKQLDKFGQERLSHMLDYCKEYLPHRAEMWVRAWVNKTIAKFEK